MTNAARGVQDEVAAAVLARAQADGLPAERTLAAALGVTRNRLRQALRTLREAGQLDAPSPRLRTTPAKGVDRWAQLTNPVEVVELRMLLEPGLARLASVRASPLDLVRVQRAANPPATMESGAADLAFHHAVATASGNALASELYALLRRVGRDARLQLGRNAPPCPARLRQRDTEHRAVLDAIAARDPDLAEHAMRDHLASVQRLVLARLTPGGSGSS